MQHLRICNNSKNRIALQNSQTFRKSLSWQRSSSKNSPRRLVGLTRSLFLKRMRALQNVWKKLQKVIRLENRSSKVKGTLCNFYFVQNKQNFNESIHQSFFQYVFFFLTLIHYSKRSFWDIVYICYSAVRVSSYPKKCEKSLWLLWCV